MMRLFVRPAILAALSLSACQEQRTIVVEQSAQVAAANVIPPPQQHVVRRSVCSAPAGTGPFEHLPKPLYWSGQRPARAVAEHVSGCAGVKFRIGPDGIPRDITVVTEYPLNYGFANAARQAVETSHWPQQDDLSWRFLVVNMMTNS